jgi:hypothetical protein
MCVCVCAVCGVWLYAGMSCIRSADAYRYSRRGGYSVCARHRGCGDNGLYISKWMHASMLTYVKPQVAIGKPTGGHK